MENIKPGNPNADDAHDNTNTLMLVGGVALVVFGAGLVLSSPMIRRYLGNVRVSTLIGGAFPDIDRYLKMRAM